MTDWMGLNPAVKLGDAIADKLMANITSEFVVPYDVCRERHASSS